jgi:hypothetical protein
MNRRYPDNSIHKFYECTEEIANILDSYFAREFGPVNDMEEINNFVSGYALGWGVIARNSGTTERELQNKARENLESELKVKKSI